MFVLYSLVITKGVACSNIATPYAAHNRSEFRAEVIITIMLVEDGQCAAYITEFGSQFVDVALTVVQGIITFLSIIGSVLLILTYVLFRPLRTKSRLLITHLAVANLLSALPNFLAVFMNFRGRFKVPNINNQKTDSSEFCYGNTDHEFFNSSVHNYCNVCVSLGFISIVGTLSTIFWTVCVCIHFFILVSYRNTKLTSGLAYVYYVIAWLAPMGICLWLLFHNWLGFQPTYSTVNCAIIARCVPRHHPYNYHSNNWNRIIGVIFGMKIWQVLVFITVPCLFVAIRCKNKKYVSLYVWLCVQYTICNYIMA